MYMCACHIVWMLYDASHSWEDRKRSYGKKRRWELNQRVCRQLLAVVSVPLTIDALCPSPSPYASLPYSSLSLSTLFCPLTMSLLHNMYPYVHSSPSPFGPVFSTFNLSPSLVSLPNTPTFLSFYHSPLPGILHSKEGGCQENQATDILNTPGTYMYIIIQCILTQVHCNRDDIT